MTDKIQVDKDEWLALLERVLETTQDEECYQKTRQELYKNMVNVTAKELIETFKPIPRNKV